MKNSDHSLGISLVFLQAFLWGLFPIITKWTYSNVHPLFSAGMSSLVAALFFALLITRNRNWKELKIREAWLSILLASLYIGVGYYGLVFIGLQNTNSGNASIILLMEIFFSMVILKITGKESCTVHDIVGGSCMFIGAGSVLLKDKFTFHSGDLILLFASSVPPLGNFYAKTARGIVGAPTIMFVRSLFSGVIFLTTVFFLNGMPQLIGLKNSFPFLLMNGVLMLGLSKIIWLEALHRISITKAVSVGASSAAFTLLFSWIFEHQPATFPQILGLSFMLVGIFFITREKMSRN